MSGISGSNTNVDVSALIGPLSSPDPASTNGQLIILRGLVDSVETAIGDTTATPPANSIQGWLQGLYNTIGANASPIANSLIARVATLVTSAASILTGLGAPADASATSSTGTFSAIALFKRIAGLIEADASSTGTTTAALVTTTASTIGTALGKGFRITNLETNAVAINVSFTTTPTTSLYSYKISPGETLFEDIKHSGPIKAILSSGSTAQNVNVTILS